MPSQWSQERIQKPHYADVNCRKEGLKVGSIYLSDRSEGLEVIEVKKIDILLITGQKADPV